MVSVLLFIIGVIVGGVVTAIIFLKVSVGWLRIDRSDPNDNPYLFLELSKNVDDVGKKKYVMLGVKNENFLSQN